MTSVNLNGVPPWGKVSIVVSAIYAFWQGAKTFFSFVPRSELLSGLAEQRNQAEVRHAELTEWLRRLDGRVGGVEQNVAALRGEVNGRVGARSEGSL